MAISERRLAANRANALRSTGPRTRGGKAAAARNALVHGLTSRNPLLPGEDLKAFRRFGQRIFDELRPVGAVQEELASEIVSLSWKLRRVPGAESLLLTETHGKGRDDEPLGELPPLRVLCNMMKAKQPYDHAPTSPVWLLDRYAVRMERSRAAALRMLLALQKRSRQRAEGDEADEDEIGRSGGRAPRAAREHAPVQNEPTAGAPPVAAQHAGHERDTAGEVAGGAAPAGPGEATAAD